jgi:cellulose biosynthesis protein BcsQ
MGAGKSGKSMILCNLAGKAIPLGKNVAYITLELQRELLAARIGSNLLNIPIDDYEKIVEDQSLLKQKLNEFKSNSLIPIGELHIKEFPASTASTIDIENYLKKAQELLGYNFDIVIIDYINIMKN